MKMIKILQLTTIIMFAFIVISGLLVFIIVPDRLTEYQQLINILFPIFLTEVVPAMIGKPLTEGVRNLTTKGNVDEKNS